MMPRPDNIVRLDTHRVATRPLSPREQAYLRDYLKPVRQANRRPPILADLRDLASDIRASWDSHLLVAVAGFVVGCLGTVGLAYLVSFAL